MLAVWTTISGTIHSIVHGIASPDNENEGDDNIIPNRSLIRKALLDGMVSLALLINTNISKVLCRAPGLNLMGLTHKQEQQDNIEYNLITHNYHITYHTIPISR